MPGILPQVLHYYVAMMSKYSNPQFHFEALTVTSSKGMAILNRKLLRFFPVSYTFCLFDKASSGSTTFFLLIHYLFPMQRIFLSMHFFRSSNFKGTLLLI